MGISTVVFLAGLQGIPSELYEAVKVYGSNILQTGCHVTLPLLRPVVAFATATGNIGALQAFTEMYTMTSGGPLDSTRTIVMHIYQAAFTDGQLGYASSAAFVLFLCIMLVTLRELRVLRTQWEY